MTTSIFNRPILTKTEVDKISTIARDRKFETKGMTFIYPVDSVSRLKFFIRSYRFLSAIVNDVPEADEVIKKKILDYLHNEEFMKLYKEALRLDIKNKNTIFFGKHRTTRKIEEFAINNYEILEHITDVVFPLGRLVKQYDPSEHVGFY